MKKSLFVGLSLLGLAGAADWQYWQTQRSPRSSQPVPKQISEQWRVVKVNDGDTLKLERNGQKQTVRLCGIDAPEAPKIRKDGTVSDAGQPLGQESKDKLQRLVDQAKGTVSIVSVDRDRYGRTVAEVFVLGEIEKSVQEEMLKVGLAYVYPEYVRQCPNAASFQQAEAIGQKQRKGVWAGEYQRPWEYRREKKQKGMSDHVQQSLLTVAKGVDTRTRSDPDKFTAEGLAVLKREGGELFQNGLCLLLKFAAIEHEIRDRN